MTTKQKIITIFINVYVIGFVGSLILNVAAEYTSLLETITDYILYGYMVSLLVIVIVIINMSILDYIKYH